MKKVCSDCTHYLHDIDGQQEYKCRATVRYWTDGITEATICDDCREINKGSDCGKFSPSLMAVFRALIK